MIHNIQYSTIVLSCSTNNNKRKDSLIDHSIRKKITNIEMRKFAELKANIQNERRRKKNLKKKREYCMCVSSFQTKQKIQNKTEKKYLNECQGKMRKFHFNDEMNRKKTKIKSHHSNTHTRKQKDPEYSLCHK